MANVGGWARPCFFPLSILLSSNIFRHLQNKYFVLYSLLDDLDDLVCTLDFFQTARAHKLKTHILQTCSTKHILAASTGKLGCKSECREPPWITSPSRQLICTLLRHWYGHCNVDPWASSFYCGNLWENSWQFAWLGLIRSLGSFVWGFVWYFFEPQFHGVLIAFFWAMHSC